MTHLSDSYTTPIIEALDEARQSVGWSRSRMFSTWIDLVLATLQRDDTTYQTHVETIERDGEPQPVLIAVARTFGELLVATATTNADVLGTVYERYGLTSDASGQFFIPPNAATAMAEMQAPPLAPNREYSPEDPLQIADPACGSGRLLFAMGRYLARSAPNTPALFVGQDIDPLCARMTAINVALAGLPGYVIHGNSLTVDAITTWQITPSRGFDVGPIQKIDPIAIMESIDTDEPTDTTAPAATTTTSHQQSTPHDQLTLSAFDEETDHE